MAWKYVGTHTRGSKTPGLYKLRVCPKHVFVAQTTKIRDTQSKIDFYDFIFLPQNLLALFSITRTGNMNNRVSEGGWKIFG
jgi:hypothetical protein